MEHLLFVSACAEENPEAPKTLNGSRSQVCNDRQVRAMSTGNSDTNKWTSAAIGNRQQCQTFLIAARLCVKDLT